MFKRLIMKIEVDQEAKNVIYSLCDVVLKLTGVANMAAVSQVLGTMKLIQSESDEISETKE